MPLSQPQLRTTPPAAPSHLRVYREDDEPQDGLDRRRFLQAAAAATAVVAAGGAVSASTAPPRLSPGMRLSEFFDAWFVPIVLSTQRKAGGKTVESYRESIARWSELTDDPALLEIDEFTMKTFDDGLGKATYRRGLAGEPRPIAESTRNKHLRNVRAVLFRCGPRGADPKRPASGLLPQTPHWVISSARDVRPKGFFDVRQAEQVYAACAEMTAFGTGGGKDGYAHTRGDGGEGADGRWRLLVALLYYTGLRIGTLRGLTWSMIVHRGEEPFLDVPADIVKTKRPIVKFVHAHAYGLLERQPRTAELILPWLSAHSDSHLLDRHAYLQRRAGLRSTLSFHAWRRTHADRMLELGMDRALFVAQQSLSHADPEITRKYYVEVEPRFIKRLPPLVRLDGDDPNQKTLF